MEWVSIHSPSVERESLNSAPRFLSGTLVWPGKQDFSQSLCCRKTSWASRPTLVRVRVCVCVSICMFLCAKCVCVLLCVCVCLSVSISVSVPVSVSGSVRAKVAHYDFAVGSGF